MPRRPPQFLVLAMDIGSSSARSALFDEKGRALTATGASCQYAVRHGADGAAELPPALLRSAVASCLRETLRSRRAFPLLQKIPVAAVGASAFWHSLLGLDGKGRPITPVFTWADSRCAADAAQLRVEMEERKIHARTGCMLRASFWPAKLRWLRRTQRSVVAKVARWVSPAEWLFEELFGARGCSHSMASGTGLYDLRAKQWDPDLCAACGVKIEHLGELTELALATGSGRSELDDAEIFTAIGDGAASNLGCGADVTGRIAINIGTSAAVRTISGPPWKTRTPFGLFRYLLDRNRTIIGGAVSNAGNLRRWCLRELQISEAASEAGTTLSRTAAASDPLTVLPFLVNERAPTWPENLRGAIVGLSQATSASQILRATSCAVYYRLGEILELIETATGPAREIIVAGGILNSPASVRLLADALGRDVFMSAEAEASLRGAAVYVLERLGCKVAPLPKGRIVRHNPKLATKHRSRGECQRRLETLLC